MTGPEHCREAERRLLMAWEENRHPDNVRHLVAEAQVHATLALAAATALKDPNCGVPDADWSTWKDAAATSGEPGA